MVVWLHFSHLSHKTLATGTHKQRALHSRRYFIQPPQQGETTVVYRMRVRQRRTKSRRNDNLSTANRCSGRGDTLVPMLTYDNNSTISIVVRTWSDCGSPLRMRLGKTNTWVKHVHPPVADKARNKNKDPHNTGEPSHKEVIHD